MARKTISDKAFRGGGKVESTTETDRCTRCTHDDSIVNDDHFNFISLVTLSYNMIIIAHHFNLRVLDMMFQS